MPEACTALVCHAATPCRPVRAICARVQTASDGTMALGYLLEGNVDRLRVPPLAPLQRADQLWEHTCFEVFIAQQDATSYCEFNFAPSREWAAYAFRRYREGSALELAWQPVIAVRCEADRLELEATLRVDVLPGMPARAPLRLGLSAVIEDEQGERSYWALRHPSGKPDFHDPAAFALTLDLAKCVASMDAG
jgi:hypothetical protein